MELFVKTVNGSKKTVTGKKPESFQKKKKQTREKIEVKFLKIHPQNL